MDRSGKRSVPSRGSVGSVIHILAHETQSDPTLPRDGTDLFPLPFEFSHGLADTPNGNRALR